jgi:hypothetical protein
VAPDFEVDQRISWSWWLVMVATAVLSALPTLRGRPARGSAQNGSYRKNLWQLTQSKRSGRPSLKACDAQNLRNNRPHAVGFPIRDDHMPWVSAPDFGQSERMVVAPGHEERGLFNMPGGQSGHPLSAYFLAGHEAWVQGRAVALLPGRAEHRLSLHP